MTATIQSVNSQLFFIVTINFDECSHNSFSIQCNEDELIGRLCEHFQIPIDLYRPISLSTLIEWLNDENIILDIFNNKGEKMSSNSPQVAPYTTKYILNDKFGNIIETSQEQIVLEEYLIKFNEWDVVENLDAPNEVQSACEKVCDNSSRWRIAKIANMEPLCITILNMN